MADRRLNQRNMQQPLPPEPDTWTRRFGRRNLGYVLFVLVTIGFVAALEATGVGDADNARLVVIPIWLWGIGSIFFFVINAILMMMDLAKGRSLRKSAIGCALPTGLMLGLTIVAQFFVD